MLVRSLLIATLFAVAIPATSALAETIALVNGEVRPADGPVVPRGTILLRDGRIAAIGADVEVPADATTIDCTGKVVTPGLIDADAGLGLAAGDRSAGRVSATFLASDAVDPWDVRIRTAREQGVTAWFSTGGVRDPLGGTTAVFSTGVDRAAPLLERAGVALNLTATDAGGGLWGAARLASVRGTLVSVRNLSEQLARWRRDLREYEEKRLGAQPTAEETLLLPPEVLAQMRAWSPSQRASWREAVYKSMKLPKRYTKPKKLPGAPRKPRSDESRDVLLGLLGPGTEGGAVRRAVIRAEMPEEVAGAIDLAREFRLDTVVLGGSGLVENATALKRRRIRVVVTQLADVAHRETGPLSRRRDGLLGQLVEAGLQPALGSGDALGGARFLRLLAAREIGRGLSEADALRSVTFWAARAAGVGDQTGSLAAGKRADVVVWSGDPFAATTRAEHVFVGGRSAVD